MKLFFINFAKSFNSAKNKIEFLKAKSNFISNNYNFFNEYFKKNANDFVLEEIKNHIFYTAFKNYLLGSIDYNYYHFYLRGKKVDETKDFLYHIKNIKTDDKTLKEFITHMDFFKELYLVPSKFNFQNTVSILKYKDENIILDGEHRAVLSELSSQLKLNYKIYE